MTTLRDRIAGALLGLHAGDALGATREFGSADPRRRHRDIVGGGPFGWEAGEPTDDTAQTAIVLAVYEKGYTVQRVANGLLKWFHAGPKDVGGSTSIALSKYSKVRDPQRSGAGQGQRGNGSLMRCLPTALVRSDPKQRAEESREISTITHNDVICVEACVTYNEMVAALLRGTTAGTALDTALVHCDNGKVADALVLGSESDMEAAADAGNPGVPHGNRGYVLDSLSLAVAALLDTRSFKEILIDVVSLGGDSDTTGAVAGGLVGARDGVESIPERWLEKLWLREELELAARRLSQDG